MGMIKSLQNQTLNQIVGFLDLWEVLICIYFLKIKSGGVVFKESGTLRECDHILCKSIMKSRISRIFIKGGGQFCWNLHPVGSERVAIFFKIHNIGLDIYWNVGISWISVRREG